MSTAMARTAVADRTETIVIECDLPHAPAKVWRALTEPGLLGAWLMPNDIRAEVGHRFTFHATPAHGLGYDVQCEVLAVEPQRRLRYTWCAPQVSLDSVVTFTLQSGTLQSGALHAGAAATRLHLEHAGIAVAPEHVASMRQNWSRLVAGCLNGQLAKLA